MILGGPEADDEGTRRFLAEAEALAQLEHPNIVQIHHVGRHGDRPFLELEYLPGGSLDQAGGTPLPPREAAGLVETLARAMQAAHRLGIVHRDLKPANVLLAADGTPKITDFGLAKDLATDAGVTRSRCLIGSAQLHGAGAGRGRARLGGPRRRYLRPRRGALRAADRPAALSGGDRPGDARIGQDGRPGAAVRGSNPACPATWKPSA